MPYDPDRHHRRSIRLRGYDYASPGWYFVTICAHGRQRLFGAIEGNTMHLNDAGRMVERWWHELERKFPRVKTDAFVVMPDHFHGIIVIPTDGDAGALAIDAGGYTNPPRRDAIVDSGAGRGAADAGALAIDAGGYTNPPRRDDAGDSNAGDASDAPRCDASGDSSVGDGDPMVGADVPIRPRRYADDRDDDADRDAGDGDPMGARAGGVTAAVSLPTSIQWFKVMSTTDYIRQVKQSGWPSFDRRVWQRGYYERIIRDEADLARIRRYFDENPARWAADHASLDALLARMHMKDERR